MKKIIHYLYRAFKFAFILFLTLGIFAYMSFLFLIKNYFSNNDIKNIIISEMQNYLKRPVKIESVNINYDGQIQLKKIYLYTKENKGYLLEVPYLTIYFNPKTLFTKNILIIKEIKMISPKLHLIKNKDGEWLSRDIFDKIKGSKGEQKVKIEEIIIEDGKITIEERENNLLHKFENLDFLIDMKEKLNITVSTDFKSDYLKNNQAVKFYLNSDLVKKEEKFSLENIDSYITFMDNTINISGNIENLNSPAANLEIKIPEINLNRVFTFVKETLIIPSSSIKTDIFYKPYEKQFDVSFYLKELNARIKGSIDFKSGFFKYKANCLVKNFQLDRIKLSLKKYIEKPSGFADLEFYISGENSKINDYSLTLKSNDLSFQEKNKILFFKNVSGKLIINNKFSSISLSDGLAYLDKYIFSKLNFRWEMEKDTEVINASFHADGNKGKIKAVIYNSNKKNKKMKVKAYLKETEIEKMIAIKDYISSKLNASNNSNNRYNFHYNPVDIYYYSDYLDDQYLQANKVYMHAELKNIPKKIDDIAGNFYIKLQNGFFKEIEKNAEKNNLYYIISLPVTTIHRLNKLGAFKLDSKMKNMDFKETASQFSVNNGKIILDNFYINGNILMAYTLGDVDFHNQKINLNVYTLSNKYDSMGGLPESLTDSKGRPALAFRIKGKFRNNDLKLLDPNDNSKIINKAIEKGINLKTEDFAF